MVLVPRLPKIPATTNSGVDNYAICHPQGLNNSGFGALPPQMTGENIEKTPILPAEAIKVEEGYKSESKEGRDLKYREPSMPYGGTVKSSIWHTRRGGAYIEVSGKRDEPEFINIVHTSGTHISLDPNGSIIIKSFGDVHNITKGNSYETTNGEKVQVSKGGYTIHIKDGTLDIRSEGNLNISSGADLSISAAGKLTLNIGDAVDIAGSKVAIHSRVDSLDLVSNGDARIHSLATLNLKSEGNMLAHSKAEFHLKSDASSYILSNSNLDIKAASSITNQADGAFNVRSASNSNIQAGGSINLKAGGPVNLDGSFVYLNSGRAGNAPNASDAAAAADGVKAGVNTEIEKSIFTENTVSASPPGTGAASSFDSPGERR